MVRPNCLLVLVAMVTAAGPCPTWSGTSSSQPYGLAVSIVGSALCCFGPDLVKLDGSRVLQAVGVALLLANSVALI